MKLRKMLIASCLLLLSGSAVLGQATMSREAQLRLDYQADLDALFEEYEAAMDAERQQSIIRTEIPELQQAYLEKFQQIVVDDPGSGDAGRALGMVLMLSNRSQNRIQIHADAKATLLADYLHHDALVGSIGYFRSDPETLDRIVEESENREVRGVAAYYSMLAIKGYQLTEANVGEVRPLMNDLISEYGDIELPTAMGESMGSIRDRVEKEIFAFENLRIGKVAPEIVGEDSAGEKFALSEYRGQVVVIDFWGDW